MACAISSRFSALWQWRGPEESTNRTPQRQNCPCLQESQVALERLPSYKAKSGPPMLPDLSSTTIIATERCGLFTSNVIGRIFRCPFPNSHRLHRTCFSPPAKMKPPPRSRTYVAIAFICWLLRRGSRHVAQHDGIVQASRSAAVARQRSLAVVTTDTFLLQCRWQIPRALRMPFDIQKRVALR